MEIAEYVNQSRTAKQVYRILTSNRFSRMVPTKPAEIEGCIRESLLNNAPLRLMGLWGGSKEGIAGDEADKRSLDFIAEMQSELRKHALPVQVSLLFCDVHHVLVNGRSLAETEQYYSVLASLAQERSLSLIKLSDLLGTANLNDYTDKGSRIKTSTVINNQAAFRELNEAARKHSNFVKNGICSEEIARIYVEVEIYFLQKISGLNPNQIFFSFSNPTIQQPIAEAAEVPMLYLHSSGKGHHNCPWYNSPAAGRLKKGKKVQPAAEEV